MSKVKMDVMKPWIATRVTELLGFEDEVLINFIYGLLDVKVIFLEIFFYDPIELCANGTKADELSMGQA